MVTVSVYLIVMYLTGMHLYSAAAADLGHDRQLTLRSERREDALHLIVVGAHRPLG
jgi:hypothetical protein